MASQGSSERKGVAHLTLKIKPEMFKFSKKAMLKPSSAKRKISYAQELTKLWMQRKRFEGN